MRKIQTFQTPFKRFLKSKKSIVHLSALLLFIGIQLLSPDFAYAQRQMEKLNRGVVAVRTDANHVFVSWRLFGTDPTDIAFNVYRGATKANTAPITNSTNFVDNVPNDEVYRVKAIIGGVEKSISETVKVWAQQYIEIPIQRPAGGVLQTFPYTYSPNDCSVGDLDGDGEYEIIVKWDPSNSKDNAQDSLTGKVYIDAYKLNGTRLWRIDLGRNIRAGAHYTQFMVYDLDGDGKAEMACKTADGTIDGLGNVIGDSTKDYRTPYGYVLSGPEYLTVFNGLTGAAMATKDYTPARGVVGDWGDSYGNRVDRFTACIAYLDGKRPSLVMGRGYYTRLVRSAWDWRDGQLTQRWIFDSNDPGNGGYAGQGNHQLTVGDVDGDGKDEICNGSSVIDDDGKGLYANGLGHGDALHMTDLDPTRPGQEVWQCHEDQGSYGNYGMEFRDAKTGIPIWGVATVGDVGRALAADIDPAHPGLECWTSSSNNLYNAKGDVIASSHPSINFAMWWDGDLSREILDGTKLDKWIPSPPGATRLISFYLFGSATQTNGTKANPNLSADILGDWREEVIFHNSDNTKLILFTTTIPTTTRIYTLMHDPQYRMAIAWQNTAYNQPPHPGFYLGNGMTTIPTPNISEPENQGLDSIVSGKAYRITAVHSGKRLDLQGGSSELGTKIIQSSSVATGYNQSWIVKSTGNGYYSITSVAADKSLETISSSKDALLWTNNNSAVNQQFKIFPLGIGKFEIVSKQNTKCLGIASESKTDGAFLEQMDCTGKNNQAFTFELLPDSVITGDFDGNALNQHLEEVIYPNPSPSSYKLNIKGAFSYTISDQLGIIMESGEGRESRVVGEELEPGIYILKIQTSQKTQKYKLIKN